MTDTEPAVEQAPPVPPALPGAPEALPKDWFTQRRYEQLSAICGGVSPSRIINSTRRLNPDGTQVHVDADGEPVPRGTEGAQPAWDTDVSPAGIRAFAQLALEAAGHSVAVDVLLDVPQRALRAWATLGVQGYVEQFGEATPS